MKPIKSFSSEKDGLHGFCLYFENKEDAFNAQNEIHKNFALTAAPKVAEAGAWTNPHDKNQKQWLPWIGEKVIVKLKTGAIHEGWHTGGSWRFYAKPAKQFRNDEIEAWIYPNLIPAPPQEAGE